MTAEAEAPWLSSWYTHWGWEMFPSQTLLMWPLPPPQKHGVSIGATPGSAGNAEGDVISHKNLDSIINSAE